MRSARIEAASQRPVLPSWGLLRVRVGLAPGLLSARFVRSRACRPLSGAALLFRWKYRTLSVNHSHHDFKIHGVSDNAEPIPTRNNGVRLNHDQLSDW